MPSSTLALQENVLLAPYTTLRIGGPARYFCEVTTEDGLLEAVRFALERGLEIFVLGGGSNLLVADAGFDGLVLHIAITAHSVSSGSEFHVASGTNWDSFVERICKLGISGIECLAGIPGSVGGTPVQNVGAYGQEVAETIQTVHALDLQTLTFVTLSHDECHFTYRSSIFNTTHRNRYIVTAVDFQFNRDAKPNLSYADLSKHFAGVAAAPKPIDVYHAVREIRHRKGMLLVEGEQDCLSAGSFFKNPVVPAATLGRIAAELSLDPAAVPHWPATEGHVKLPAAWLLERAGFVKGFALGEAGISSRHTLALINRGHATAADIFRLRDAIQLEVKNRLGIQLQQEPVQLG